MRREDQPGEIPLMEKHLGEEVIVDLWQVRLFRGGAPERRQYLWIGAEGRQIEGILVLSPADYLKKRHKR